MMQLGHRRQFAARATGQYFLAAAEDQYAVVARLRRRLLPENASEAIVAEAAARVALSLAQHRTQLPKPAHFTVVLALVSRVRGGDHLAPSAANVVHIAFAKDSSSTGVPVITAGCPLMPAPSCMS